MAPEQGGWLGSCGAPRGRVQPAGLGIDGACSDS